jgi:SOS response regulatory protein OraA/RecX
MPNELAETGVYHSIIIELNKNQQIDWYLQAELAYNKRFGESEIKDQKKQNVLGLCSIEVSLMMKSRH